MTKISTPRLHLIELTRKQLELCLSNFPAFENALNLTIAGDFVTELVQRAIRMKVEKMRAVDESQQAWLAYWLVVIKEENIGAGMLGFKGYPNAEGSTEIGYGIDPVHQNKGYMSEAVRALIDWAFSIRSAVPSRQPIWRTLPRNACLKSWRQRKHRKAGIHPPGIYKRYTYKGVENHLSIPAKCV
jgi:RimJ/RimL family protein N-acetyltransferase